MNTNARITEFQGDHRFLSNFWPATVEFEDKTYSSVEHAYQAAKTLNQNDREQIRRAHTAGIAKRAGRLIEIRPDWEWIKLDIMHQLVAQKFIYNTDLGKKLVATGDAELIEGNHWGDTFWGVCKGRGENHLGKILMNVRRYIQLRG